jgi:hypothetical protein
MGLGDFSETRDATPFKVVPGTVDPGYESRFWDNPVFDVATLENRREWYWVVLGVLWRAITWLVRALYRWFVGLVSRPRGQPAPRRTGRRVSLLKVFEKETDRLALGNRFGARVWEVPFGHIYLTCAQDGPCDPDRVRDINTAIEKTLEARLTGYIDPYAGLQVRCMATHGRDGPGPGEVRAYIGTSVFAARRDAVPVGTLRFYPDAADEGNFETPRYLNGRQAAALYRGQRAIGFAIDDRHAPVSLRMRLQDPRPGQWAVVEGLTLPHDGLVFAASFKPQAEGSFVDATPLPPEPGSDVDQSWRIIPFNSAGSRNGRLDLCLDTRASRLRYTASTPHDVAIDAIRVPRGRFATEPKRVWLEFDGLGRLIFSALQKRRFSLCWDFRERSWIAFDWENLRPTNSARIGAARPGGGGVNVAEVDGVAQFTRSDGSPFGYLRLGPDLTALRFDPEATGPQVLSLDWLDFAGYVDFGTQTLGLAEAYATVRDMVLPTNATAQTFDLGPCRMVR